MRIVMVCADDWIDRRILQQAESLTEGGHKVIILAAWVEGEPEHRQHGRVTIERVPPPIATTTERVTHRVAGVLRAPLPGKSKGLVTLAERAFLHLTRGWRELTPLEDEILRRIKAHRPDCVHVHDLPQLRVGVAAKREIGIPLVYDAHELFPELSHLSWGYRRLWRARERRYIKEASLVTTVNSFLANEMAKLYDIPAPDVILNAVDAPPTFNVHDRHNRLRERFNIPNSEHVLLYQGYLYPDRALEPMVEAMQHVTAPVRLVVMGMGPLRGELERLAARLPGPRRAHVFGPVPQDEVLWWTASADAGIIPYQAHDLNKKLCAPNKLFEFIQAGLPMIANDLPMLREVIAVGELGEVFPLTDARSYAAAIDRYFAEPWKLREHRRNVIRARGKYNWTNEGRTLLRLYRRHVERRTRAA